MAKRWKVEGKIKKIGLGMAQLEHLQQLPDDHLISCVLAPYNAFNQDSSRTFLMAREMGHNVIALSPFIRGWKLEEIGEDRDDAAEILLRWVSSQQLVDHVIVSMRKKEWVTTNRKAANHRDSLTDIEKAKLIKWIKQLG